MSQSHQLIGRQHENAEHQMSGHLLGTLHAQGIATEFILETGIGALSHRAFAVSHRLGRIERDLLASTRIVVDQGNMSQTAAMRADVLATVGRIHQVI